MVNTHFNDSALFELAITLEMVDGDECVLAHLSIPNGEQLIKHDYMLNLRTETATYCRTIANTRTHQIGPLLREVQHKSFFESACLWGPMAQWLARGIGGVPREHLTLTTPPITR